MSTNSEKTGEKLNRISELEKMLTDAKIKPERIEKMKEAGIETNVLPASGTFADVILSGREPEAGKDDFRHLRMTVIGTADSISLGNITIIAPLKSEFDKEQLLFLKQRKDPSKLYLQGKSINPALTKFSTLELAAYLEGKKFTATKVDVWNLPYKAEGYTKVEDAKNNVSLKTAYQLTIVE